MSIKISVIIPIYNGVHFLIDAVNSALKQTVAPFEIILVDDASTDESKILADTLEAKYQKVRCVHHNINQGVSAAWNTGFGSARGDLLLRLAQDDTLEKNALEILAHCAHDNVKADVFYADCLFVDVQGNAEIFTTTNSSDLFINSNRIGLCVAIRRRVWESGFRYDPNFKAAEDFDFFTRVFTKHRFMKCSSPPLMRVLRHTESGSSKSAARQHLEAAQIARRLKNSRAQQAIIFENYIAAIYLSRSDKNFTCALKIVMSALSRFPMAWKIWKQLFAIIIIVLFSRRA